MPRLLTCITTVLTLVAMAAPAASGTRSRVRNAEPVKDCTPINGRYGYYGNPWCSPAEQQAWDRAQARRLGR